MIPLKDYNPTRTYPFLTVLLIVINISLFILDVVSGHYEPVLIETPAGMVKTVQFVGGLMAAFALVPGEITTDFWGSWPTVFTSMFLHGNWLHIGSNMLYLWIFGNNIEDVLGRFRFILFYFMCGAIAAAAQIMSAPSSPIPMVGASGAVAGVMGAYLLLFPQARILTLVPLVFFFPLIEVPAYFIIGYWALLQFLSSFLSSDVPGGGIAYFAHVGGFVAGLFLIYPMKVTRFRSR